MKSNSIKFRIAAFTSEAARENNEDALLVDDNLSDDIVGQFKNDAVVDMNGNGILLMVADGMGGMNAGEVASAIASNTVKTSFEKEKIADVVKSPAKIRKYIEETIVLADSNIKEEGKGDPDKAGMGSTIVLVWIVNGIAYVGWCGDSRAYCFNRANGLVRLSHDHSYVQELVDAGKIDEEVAIYHPDSNIITRSLGDPRKAAKPDIMEFPVHEGDIFLLCSDGLCGVLQDREIEGVMRGDYEKISDMRKALWTAAEAAGWHDNVTTVLCEIVSGGEKPEKTACDEPARGGKGHSRNAKTVVMSAIIVVLVAVIGWMVYSNNKLKQNNESAEACLDSLEYKRLLELNAESLVEYINNNQEGKFKEFAEARLDTLLDKADFEKCSEANDFRNYLNNRPKGLYADEAQHKLDSLVADPTQKVNEGKVKTVGSDEGNRVGEQARTPDSNPIELNPIKKQATDEQTQTPVGGKIELTPIETSVDSVNGNSAVNADSVTNNETIRNDSVQEQVHVK